MIEAEEGVAYAGVQAYAGNVQHVLGFEERRAANRAANERLQAIVTALKAAGLAPGIITGGGTGSHMLDFEDHVLDGSAGRLLCLHG